MARTTTSLHVLTFTDKRAPQEIQVVLERQLMALFTRRHEDWRIVLRVETKVNGCPYVISLRLDETGMLRNHYTFSSSADWSQFGEEYDEYFAKNSGSWFEFWTRDFAASDAPNPSLTPSAKYERIAELALAFESNLQSVEEIQAEIVKRMRHGAKFRTSHKEGGTTISAQGAKFLSEQYGDDNGFEYLQTEEDMLRYVRQFFDMETKRASYPDSPPELDVWRLILRLLYD